MMRAIPGGLALLLAISVTAGVHAQRQDVIIWVTLGDSDQLVEVDAYTFTEIRRITTDPRAGLVAALTNPKGAPCARVSIPR